MYTPFIINITIHTHQMYTSKTCNCDCVHRLSMFMFESKHGEISGLRKLEPYT